MVGVIERFQSQSYSPNSVHNKGFLRQVLKAGVRSGCSIHFAFLTLLKRWQAWVKQHRTRAAVARSLSNHVQSHGFALDFVAASLKNFRVTLQRGKNNSFAAEPLECCFRLFSSTNSPTYMFLPPHCLGSLAGVILSCHDWSLLCLTGLGDDFIFDFTNLFTLKTCWVSQLCPGEPREGPVASKLQVEVHDAEPKAPETKAAMAVPAVPAMPKPPTVSCRDVHFH